MNTSTFSDDYLRSLKGRQLVALYNQLNPSQPLSGWKGRNEALVDRIKALKANEYTTVVEMCEKLLLEVTSVKDDRPMGRPYQEILEMVKQQFPEGDTSYNCLRWYASNLRSEGKIVPARPRPRRKTA